MAVTHTQARYALPPIVTAFKRRYPTVKLKLLQGNPHQLARIVIEREADIAIATEALADYEELVSIPCYQWHHCVVVPAGHELASRGTDHARGGGALPDRHLRHELSRGARPSTAASRSAGSSRRSPSRRSTRT